MNNNRQQRNWTVLLIFLISSSMWAQTSNPADHAISVKVVKDSVVVVTTPSAKLNEGDNKICVVVRDASTGSSIDVRKVSLEFRLHVGRTLQRPIKAQLTSEGVGRYCGHINLGRLYYSPSVFHAEVRYEDLQDKRRKSGFCISAG